MKRVYRCGNCGSERLVWRGYFVWDESAQAFEVTQPDNEAYCETCDSETEPFIVFGQGAMRAISRFISDLEIDVACLLDNCDDDLRFELQALQTKLDKFSGSLEREG